MYNPEQPTRLTRESEEGTVKDGPSGIIPTSSRQPQHYRLKPNVSTGEHDTLREKGMGKMAIP